MPRGRKPKPTRLKILHGNPGKRALNDQEPQPPSAVPRCPSHLTKEARTEWRRLVKHLDPIGLVTHLDRSLLAAFCQAWGDWVTAQQMIAQTGFLVKDRDGELRRNPCCFISIKAVEQMCRLGPLLGLDPTSRTRIKVQPRGPADEMEALLGEIG